MTNTTLADRFLHQRTFDNPFGKIGPIDNTSVQAILRRAERYVLDDAATRMAVDLSHASPKQVEQMISLAWPAAGAVWVEMPAVTMLQRRAALHPGHSYQAAIDERDPNARTAMLVERQPERLVIWLVEDVAKEDYTPKEPSFAWVLGYHIYREPQLTAQDLDQIKIIWGYTEPAKVDVLARRGYVSMSASIAQRLGQKGIYEVATEMAGFTRLSLAILTMLNTIATVEPATRPAGLRLVSGGHSRPYLSRSLVTVRVPKRVRDTRRWAQKQIATAHRRLHEVRAHWRHLKHQPRRPGWEAIEIDGTAYWRRVIDAHLRGDAELGVVSHDGFEVKGRSP